MTQEAGQEAPGDWVVNHLSETNKASHQVPQNRCDTHFISLSQKPLVSGGAEIQTEELYTGRSLALRIDWAENDSNSFSESP